MTAQRPDALWVGWGGTALFLATWLLIASISALSFPLWIGLMLLGTVMCFYGGLRRSRWFFLPRNVRKQDLLETSGLIARASAGRNTTLHS